MSFKKLLHLLKKDLTSSLLKPVSHFNIIAVHTDDKRPSKLPPLRPRGASPIKNNRVSNLEPSNRDKEAFHSYANDSNQPIISSMITRRQSAKKMPTICELKERSSSKSPRNVKRGPSRRSTTRSNKSVNVI